MLFLGETGGRYIPAWRRIALVLIEGHVFKFRLNKVRVDYGYGAADQASDLGHCTSP
jgi:hypothetical protein